MKVFRKDINYRKLYHKYLNVIQNFCTKLISKDIVSNYQVSCKMERLLYFIDFLCDVYKICNEDTSGTTQVNLLYRKHLS